MTDNQAKLLADAIREGFGKIASSVEKGFVIKNYDGGIFGYHGDVSVARALSWIADELEKIGRGHEKARQSGAERNAAALEKIAVALEGLGCRISEDEPLNYAVARGLDRISEAQKR